MEHLGTLTFLVKLNNGMLWKRHVDQLRHLEDSPRDVIIPDSTQEVTSTKTFYLDVNAET